MWEYSITHKPSRNVLGEFEKHEEVMDFLQELLDADDRVKRSEFIICQEWIEEAHDRTT